MFQPLSEFSFLKFTFHNVSINTIAGFPGSEEGTIFTFHNVSINTGKQSQYC